MAPSAFRPCVLIPTYDNPETIAAVVEQARAHLGDVVVVDDGSGPTGRAAVERLSSAGLAHVHHRERNGGKGAAVKSGFRVARELGFTHALQIDADGQHEVADIPKFLDEAAQRPDALILGAPIYDGSAPRSRVAGREITRFWTNIETGGRVIDDPMCGFRVYPLEQAAQVRVWGDRMDFDIEIAVRLAWHGTPIINLPTRVRYVSGGVSHFHMLGDNIRISWAHARLVTLALCRLVFGWLRKSK